MKSPDLDSVRWISLQSVTDDRGTLTAVEGGSHTPFEIRRVFYMHDIRAERGGHAHRDTDQLVIAGHGSFRVTVMDGRSERTYTLDDARRGLFIPRLIFTRLYDFSPGAVVLVLANTHYDMARSIRSWDDYVRIVRDP